jgi:hypothetical protein
MFAFNEFSMDSCREWKMHKTVLVCSVVIAAFALSSPALAAQKTVKACQGEWRANKAANQAAKITEKAYVEKCRADSASAQPDAAPATKPAAAPAAASAPTASKPAAKPAPTAAKPAPMAPAASATPTGANQFAAEGQAKARCPADTVVWVNLPTKIYHFAGKKDYGNTKSGAYMCEKDAVGSGIRAAKNEKHP